MKREGNIFSLTKRFSIIKQLAEVVSNFQTLRKIHGDIKPANIFIKNQTLFILGDLESSVEFQRDEYGATLSVNQFIASTLPYTAPELLNIENQMRCTYKIDNWSLGVTLFEAFEQEWPFGDYEEIKQDYDKIKEKIQ